MPYYVLLIKLTDQGARNVKDSPKRAQAAQEVAEKLGGKLTVYYTFGEYDIVCILEAPNDEAALAFEMKQASLGNIRTTTLKAFTLEEAGKVANSQIS
jgi:uncharacterized protein with GYD domain